MGGCASVRACACTGVAFARGPEEPRAADAWARADSSNKQIKLTRANGGLLLH